MSAESPQEKQTRTRLASQRHYLRKKGINIPLIAKNRWKNISIEERFWSKINIIDDENSCWEWTGLLDGAGYGKFRTPQNAQTKTHRFSYELHNKVSLTPKEKICHTCDNPRCVRPTHLFKGTQKDNMVDMVNKGRSGGKLNPSEVRKIKQKIQGGLEWGDQKRLAKQYSIAESIISRIKHGTRWGDLED